MRDSLCCSLCTLIISDNHCFVNMVGDNLAVNKYTEARRKANEKYNAKAYDEIKVRVSKGDKEKVRAHAESRGESLNGFINRAIDETMKRDTKKTV